ncbi:MAG: glycosyltransferase family 1 protein [Dongiaceae bacterium]
MPWRPSSAKTYQNGRAESPASGIGGEAPAALICLSHLRWSFVWQRPQHLMSRCARRMSVFFVEEPVFRANAAPHLDLRLDSSGVTVGVPVLPEGLGPEERDAELADLLDGLVERLADHRLILWFYTPMALAFAGHLAPALTIYDCMDELSAFRGAPPELARREEELLRRADLVLTGGHSLYEAKRRRHGSVHAFPSSVDLAHFARARRPSPLALDQDRLPRPRLGYYGVIDERLDTRLLAEVARLRPHWQLVMVGPVVKIDPAELPRAPNLHYLGGRPYEELPDYLAGWDVALMPFAINRSTRYISPTKTPEYLAGGRPVVSTPVPDVVRAYGEPGLVAIAGDPQGFVAAIERCLGPWDRAGWLRRVDAALAGQSWDATWSAMAAQIDRALEAAAAGPGRRPPPAELGVASG